jgi:FixJ family two-component response regulator
MDIAGGRVTVGIVEDDPSVLRSLERLLRVAGYRVLPFSSAEECLARLGETQPDCLLLDLNLPGLDGLALQKTLAERHPAIGVVFLTGHGDVPSSVAALKRGAADFLEKPVDDQRLLAALGEAVGRAAAQRAELDEVKELDAVYGALTPREQEILSEVVSGRLNKQIALRLGIAEGTVKVHRGQVMRKMGADSLADLVRMASRLGLGADDSA